MIQYMWECTEELSMRLYANTYFITPVYVLNFCLKEALWASHNAHITDPSIVSSCFSISKTYPIPVTPSFKRISYFPPSISPYFLRYAYSVSTKICKKKKLFHHSLIV